MNINLQPGAVVRADAERYVGGKTVFLALQNKYPEILKPFYQTSKRTVYRLESIDTAMRAAAMEKEPLTTVNLSK